jgi:hypothetical protein
VRRAMWTEDGSGGRGLAALWQGKEERRCMRARMLHFDFDARKFSDKRAV